MRILLVSFFLQKEYKPMKYTQCCVFYKEATTGQVALNYAVRNTAAELWEGENVLQAVSFGVGIAGQR